jgi:hypothetical protein
MPTKYIDRVYNSDGTRNYRYAEDGTDLTVLPIVNPNPLDIVIPPGRTVGDIVSNWNNFYSFVREIKGFNTTNPQLNSLEGQKSLTTQLINEYNSNERFHTQYKYLKNLPLTQEDIRAIQTFTKITDPNVIIDGFLGTQTIQMEYPRAGIVTVTDVAETLWIKNHPDGEPFPQSEIKNLPPQQQLLFVTPKDSDFVPYIWGNKRYVMTYKQYVSTWSTRFDKSFYNLLVPYDPAIHKPLIPRYTPLKWDALGEDVVINQPASLKNITTQHIQNQKTTLQSQTNLIKSIR